MLKQAQSHPPLQSKDSNVCLLLVSKNPTEQGGVNDDGLLCVGNQYHSSSVADRITRGFECGLWRKLAAGPFA